MSLTKKTTKSKSTKSSVNNLDKSTVILTLLVAVSFLLLGYFGRMVYDSRQNDKAKDVAVQAINDIVAGDTAAAYQMTSGSLQANQSAEEFEAALVGLQSEDPRPLEAQLLKGRGKILVQQYIENLPATSTGKTSGDFYVTMVKDGSSWKIASISVQ